MFDRQHFFSHVRSAPFGGRLSQAQINGMSAILDGWEARFPNGDKRWLAYMFATTFHETAKQMVPVKEAYWLSEDWRKRHLSYYPYYGRGFVQLTHRGNYKHAGEVLGVDMVRNPDLALVHSHAAVIMFTGMTEGWFRADQNGVRHDLPRYFNTTTNSPIGARKIINGFEPGIAEAIAGYHANFLAALQPATRAVPAMGLTRGFAVPGAEETLAAYADADDESIESYAVNGDGPVTNGISDLQLQRITADIVVAYLNKNTVSQAELMDTIAGIYVAISNADAVVARQRFTAEDRVPGPGPRPVKKSARKAKARKPKGAKAKG